MIKIVNHLVYLFVSLGIGDFAYDIARKIGFTSNVWIPRLIGVIVTFFSAFLTVYFYHRKVSKTNK